MSTLIPTYVFTEMTPNPSSMKFVADRAIIPADTIAEFNTPAEAEKGSPLASSLFKFPFVKSVFIMNNFATVTKTEDIDWELVKNEIREHIQRYLMENKLAVSEGFKGLDLEAERGMDLALAQHKVGTELEQKIADLLDEYVKPAVERDGGIIQLESFNSGTVTVNLRGACSGCPSSTVTLKDGIENLLKSMLPEVNEVVALT